MSAAMMAIKPITGSLRRHIIRDLTIGLVGGLAAGSAWWYGFHVPRVRLRDEAYSRIEQAREGHKKALREAAEAMAAESAARREAEAHAQEAADALERAQIAQGGVGHEEDKSAT